MMDAAAIETPSNGRIGAGLMDAAAKIGLRFVHLHNRRALCKRDQDLMMLQLYELGWSMEQIAQLPATNAHRTTVARSIRAGRSSRDIGSDRTASIGQSSGTSGP